MKLAFVIPAYNEEKTIAQTVSKIKQWGLPIVANDCSKDETAKRASEAGAHVVTHLQNKGYDGALNTGFVEAANLGFTHVITFDADGQHPSEKIIDYIRLFEANNELVIGIRPRKQRFSENLFALYTELRFGVKDPLCGMKGYDLKKYREIGFFDSIGSTGTELMLRYLKMKAPFAQIPIPISDRLDQPRFGSIWRGNKRILKSLWNSWSKIP